MGRKIPGKKHRGVKDPLKQHAQRLAILKTKINKVPIRPDEQPIPRSLVQLMSWKNKKQGKDSENKHNAKPVTKKNDSSTKSHANPLNKMQRLDGESKRSFGARINEALKTLKKDATFDDVLNDMPKERTRENNTEGKIIKRKKKKLNNDVRLTKSQKKTQKEKEIKKNIREQKEFDKRCEIKNDIVQFGEIVHEPPALKIKPRKAEVADGAPRPARKDLLLNKLFDKDNTSDSHNTFSVVKDSTLLKMKSDGVDLTGKRKNLPQNVRKKLEESQKEAIEAYKRMKQSQIKNKNV